MTFVEREWSSHSVTYKCHHTFFQQLTVTRYGIISGRLLLYVHRHIKCRRLEQRGILARIPDDPDSDRSVRSVDDYSFRCLWRSSCSGQSGDYQAPRANGEAALAASAH